MERIKDGPPGWRKGSQSCAACSYRCLVGSQAVVFFSCGFQKSASWVYYCRVSLFGALEWVAIVPIHWAPICRRNCAVGAFCKSFHTPGPHFVWVLIIPPYKRVNKLLGYGMKTAPTPEGSYQNWMSFLMQEQLQWCLVLGHSEDSCSRNLFWSL